MTDTSAAPSTETTTSPLAAIGVVAAFATAVALWAPLVDGGDSLAEGADGWLYAYVLGLIAVTLVGTFGTFKFAIRAGLVVGALIGLGGFFAFNALVGTWSVTEFDADVGAGLLAAWTVPLVAITALWKLFSRLDGDDRFVGPAGTVGVVAAAGTILGVMVPPSDSGMTFESRNFEFGSWMLQIGWLLLLAGIGLPGIIGFSRRTIGGLATATAGLVGPAILFLSSTADASEIASDAYHPLFPIALAAWAVALLLGKSAVDAIPATARATGASEEFGRATSWPMPTIAGSPAVVPADELAEPEQNEVLYSMTSWSESTTAGILAQLDARSISYEFAGEDELVVDKRHESLVDRIVEEIDGQPVETMTPLPEADPEVLYGTADWSVAQFVEVTEALDAAGIGYYTEDGNLIVSKPDEATVDSIVTQVTGTEPGQS